MSDIRKRLLPPFLVFSGIVCLSAYPLHIIWPSGWEWGMEGPISWSETLPTSVEIRRSSRGVPFRNSRTDFENWNSSGDNDASKAEQRAAGDVRGRPRLSTGVWHTVSRRL